MVDRIATWRKGMSHPMQVEGHCQVLGLLPSAALLLHRLLEGVVYYRASPRAVCSTCFWDIAMQSCVLTVAMFLVHCGQALAAVLGQIGPRAESIRNKPVSWHQGLLWLHCLFVTCAGRLRHRHRRQLAISRCILGGRWQMRYRTSHLALTASWPAHRCCRRVAVAASLRCTNQLWHTLIAGLGQRTSVWVALPLLSVMARLQLLRADSTGCRFEAVSAFTDMACTASTK